MKAEDDSYVGYKEIAECRLGCGGGVFYWLWDLVTNVPPPISCLLLRYARSIDEVVANSLLAGS